MIKKYWKNSVWPHNQIRRTNIQTNEQTMDLGKLYSDPSIHYSHHMCRNVLPKIFATIAQTKKNKEESDLAVLMTSSYICFQVMKAEIPRESYVTIFDLDWNAPDSEYKTHILIPRDTYQSFTILLKPIVKKDILSAALWLKMDDDSFHPNCLFEIITLCEREGQRMALQGIHHHYQRFWSYRWIQSHRNPNGFKFEFSLHLKAIQQALQEGKQIPGLPIVVQWLFQKRAKEELYVQLKQMVGNEGFFVDKQSKSSKQFHLCLDVLQPRFEDMLKRGWDPQGFGKGSMDVTPSSRELELETHYFSEFRKCLSTELYEYQERAILWMNRMEQKICNRKIPLSFLPSLQWNLENHPDVSIYASLTPPRFIVGKKEEYITLQGGMLCDEMGLGKSLMVLCLVFFSSLRHVMYESQNEWISQQIILPYRSRATLIVCPGHICDQWKREFLLHFDAEFKKQHTKQIIVLESARQLDFLKPQRYFIAICLIPFHISRSKPQQRKRFTYQDLCNADIVIVSWTLLNKNETEGMNDHQAPKQVEVQGEKNKIKLCDIYWHRIVVDEAHEIIDAKTVTKVLRSQYAWYVSGTPLSKGIESLAPICAFLDMKLHTYDYGEIAIKDFRVHLIGTFIHKMGEPCTNTSSMKHYKDKKSIFKTYPFSDSKEQETVALQKAKLQVRLMKWLFPFIFWRNTKHRVRLDQLLPEKKEETVILEFTPMERQLYDDYARSRDLQALRQMCAHPQVSKRISSALSNANVNKKIYTMEEIGKVMHKENEKQLQALLIEVETTKTAVDALQKTLSVLVEMDKTESSKADQKTFYEKQGLDQLQREQTKLKKKENELKAAQRNKNYMESIIPILDGKVDMNQLICGICQEPIMDITFTPCNHYFCWVCIDQWMKNSHDGITQKCPQCREICTLKQLMRTQSKKTNNSSNANSDQEMQQLKERYGTKMAFVIHYITRIIPSEDPESKIILFSQWDELLRMIYDTLTENQIQCTLCQGTAMTKRKKLDQFRNDNEFKVILLSTNNTASGTNLPQANRIIFLDPILKNPEEARAFEEQAISRSYRQGQKKNVHVVRLIIKDTIEEDIHTINQVGLENMIPKEDGTGITGTKRKRTIPTPEQYIQNMLRTRNVRRSNWEEVEQQDEQRLLTAAMPPSHESVWDDDLLMMESGYTHTSSNDPFSDYGVFFHDPDDDDASYMDTSTDSGDSCDLDLDD